METMIWSFIADGICAGLIVWGVSNTIRTLHSMTEFGAHYLFIAIGAIVPLTIFSAIFAQSLYEYKHPHIITNSND